MRLQVARTDRSDSTYNLTVNDFETYFVGELRVLVHNCNNGSGAAKNDRKRQNAKRIKSLESDLAKKQDEIDEFKKTQHGTKAFKKSLAKLEAQKAHLKREIKKASEPHGINPERR